jgi:quinol-cytochrome oxidoreductase complex cytochrome b subunit
MNKKNLFDKLYDWFDEHFGFAKTPLKPIPDFALNPIYWLGLLMAVTFALQVATGIFMLLYYVPTPEQAYSSTTNIITSVPLGQIVETMHLYTAYAMILLTFMHLARNYFGSAHKEKRTLMWLAGMVLFVLVLSFGVTGYLLPWTVISKSATDVAIGFVNFFPTPLANLARFVLVGDGSDASEITSFLHIHTVFLPMLLIAFLALKVYMYEVHGPSYVAAYGKPKKGKIYSWFPKIFLYATILFSSYIAILLATSALLPLVLPPAFSAATAGQYVVQPDWYLLFVYQILKFQMFEGPGAIYAIVALGIVAVLLVLLPFYDRSKRRGPSQRPLFMTIGAIGVAEFMTLTLWGYLTPGQVIPDWQAVLVLGGVAAATAGVMGLIYRVRRTNQAVQASPTIITATSTGAMSKSTPRQMPSTAKKQSRLQKINKSMFSSFTALFVFLLVAASASLASLVNVTLNPGILVASLVVFGFSLVGMCSMVRSYVLAYEKGRGDR